MFHDTDRFGDFRKGLPGQPGQQVGTDLVRREADIEQPKSRLLKLAVIHLQVQRFSFTLGNRFQPEPQRLETGPKEQICRLFGDPPDVKCVGRMKPDLHAGLDDTLEDGGGMPFGIDQKRIVIEHKIPDMVVVMPIPDLFDNPVGASVHAFRHQ